MPRKHRVDPMLQKMVSPEQRATELKLLAEFEASGRIRRVDYIHPASVEEDDELSEFKKVEGEEDLGDGNRWKTSREE